MNNPDERGNQGSSSLATVIYYAVGGSLSALLIFAGMQIFRDYFYGEGINRVIPSLLLLLGSLAIGFFCSKWIMKKFGRFKKR